MKHEHTIPMRHHLFYTLGRPDSCGLAGLLTLAWEEPEIHVLYSPLVCFHRSSGWNRTLEAAEPAGDREQACTRTH